MSKFRTWQLVEIHISVILKSKWNAIILLWQTLSYLSLGMFPRSVDEVDGEDLQAQPSLDTVHHYMQAFTVPDYEARVVQFISHLFEVQVGILRNCQSKQTNNIKVDHLTLLLGKYF